MKKLNFPILNSLEEILETSIKMDKVVRWGKYHDNGECRKETTFQHSYKASLLATIILDNELNYSSDFNPYIVLKATVIHDLGEIKEGDTVYIDKTLEGDHREYSFFQSLISALPLDVQKRLDEAYNLQNTGKRGFGDVVKEVEKKYSKEAKLFEAIEMYGYLIFAYREHVKDDKEEILVNVLRNQHERLNLVSNHLQGFRTTFYTHEMHDSIVDFLKKYEGKYIEKKNT